MTTPFKYSFEKAKITRARCGKTLLKDFHMRETDGRDEELAANWAKQKGGSASASEEMVRLAIVAVNGEAVVQPYLQFDVWNQKARALALKAFGDLNGFTNKEGEDFLESAMEEDVGPAPPPRGQHAPPSEND